MCNFGGFGDGVSAEASKAEYKTKQFYGLKPLTRIKICRIPLFTGGVPGHYWVQISHADKSIESYGWYPAQASQVLSALGYPGCINGDSPARRKDDVKTLETKKKKQEKIDLRDLKAGRGIGNQPHPYDPHHDDVATKHKHNPYLFLEDGRSEEQVIEEIRSFAKSYKSHWNWKADDYTEENCHTFLFNLLHKVNLADIHILDDGHFSRYYLSAKVNSYRVANPFDFRTADAIANKMRQVKANAERLDRAINMK